MKWPSVELGEVVEFHAGIGFPPALQGRTAGDFPFAKVGDISRRGRMGSKYIESADNYVTKADLVTLRAKPVAPGSTVFAKIGEAIRHNHRAIVAREILIDNNAMAATPKPSLDPNYLYRFLQSVDLYRHATSTTVPSLRKTVLQRIPMPFPSLGEQRRIAAVLDHADTLRTARLRTTTLAEEAGRAVFLEMFGRCNGEHVTIDDVALPENGSIRTGPFGSQLLHSEFVPEGISVLGLDNVVGNSFTWGERRFITPEKYESLKRYTVQPGDVLVSIMGTCGRCVVVPPDVGAAINTKHICAITLNQSVALPEFVRASFLWHPKSHRYLTQQTKGAIMDGLNMGIIKQMPLPLPSLEVQQQFVTRLSEIDGLAIRLRESSEQLGELFAALQSRAFSGQL